MNTTTLVPPVTADAVSHNLCLGCGLCALNCPTTALVMEEMPGSGPDQLRKSPSLRPELCVHCGRCAAVCPSGTILQYRMEALVHRVREESIHAVVFFCENLNLFQPTPLERRTLSFDMPLLDARQRPRVPADVPVPEGVLLEEVRCTGRVGPRLLLRLALVGVKDIAIWACPPGRCQYGNGRPGAREHAAAVMDMLAQYGVTGVRLLVRDTPPPDSAALRALLENLGGTGH